MILHAFFDESGSHNNAAITVVAGYIATKDQWLSYEDRTKSLFMKYGIKLFHAVDLKRGSGDFKDWSVDRKIQFLDEFQHILNEELAFGISAFLKNEDYIEYLNKPWPKGTRKDTKYTILFRACMASALEILETEYRALEPQLRTVFESGHKNSGDAERCYKWISEAHPDSKRVLLGLAFENKKNLLPLAAADHLAFGIWRYESGLKPIGIARQVLLSPLSYEQNIRRIPIDKSVLDNLHAQAITLKIK